MKHRTNKSDRNMRHWRELREMARASKCMSDAERDEQAYWDGVALGSAQDHQQNPARVVCIYADPHAPSRLTFADDKLSRAFTELESMARAEQADFDDPITQSAPSECGQLISGFYTKGANRVARRYGFESVDELAEVVQHRVCGRWLYFKSEGSIFQYGDRD